MDVPNWHITMAACQRSTNTKRQPPTEGHPQELSSQSPLQCVGEVTATGIELAVMAEHILHHQRTALCLSAQLHTRGFPQLEPSGNSQLGLGLG